MKRYTVVQWSDDADNRLSRALPNDEVRAIIADEVRNGVALLWRCESDEHFAYCVTRQDSRPDELCIVAFEGSGVKEFAAFFIDAAHAKGLPVRCHVVDERLARLYRRAAGMNVSEIVLRSNPNGQRH